MLKNIPVKKIFDKNSIREVVREWIPNLNESYIEYYEEFFCESVNYFVYSPKMKTSEAYYTTILEDKEYIEIFKKNVHRLFMNKYNEKNILNTNKYESYKCVNTIPGFFYEGEIYKYYLNRYEKNHGKKINLENKEEKYTDKFNLVPEGGFIHLIVDKDNFIKVI